MQAYYAVPCPPLAEIEAALAGRPAGTEILVAEDGAALAGFAAFSAIYPGPGLAGGLFLKELFVGAAHRGAGHGRALVRAVAAEAVVRGLKRVDWTADAGRPELLAFYEGLGALRKPDKVFFRLDGEGLVKLGGPA
ncbi:GNAT family N-acetyltransferase [Methylobacterium nonmethylotrophicum]|uniref:GNAT family N-acetyltransferase n=1 Tax=Methylobacterium nonmethylotrophicum TaxID=1141884 RepID=A0A4Z0NFM8_9HYPH|nr:GNAT family N-acetyltransferase [Methylobacterium nonmethylotrophicum]TGD94865.1 GNAT family N-acetyltransferase [Methylobacterium nonmethylotrophicum]